MIIVDPVALGDTSYTGGGGTYYDRNGVLQVAITNVLRVTYDPSDLSKAPYALVEATPTTNLLTYSEQVNLWTTWQSSVTSNSVTAPDGNLTADTLTENSTFNSHTIENSYSSFVAGQSYTFSVFVKAKERTNVSLSFKNGGAFLSDLSAFFDLAAGTVTSVSTGVTASIKKIGTSGWYRISATTPAAVSGAGSVFFCPIIVSGALSYLGDGVSSSYVWGAQLELGQLTNYVPTTGTAATRTADVIGSTAGLVYSNVAIAETAYSALTTYSIGQKVYDPTTHKVYESLVNSNLGNALTNTAKWLDDGATNRWAMLDQYNNTQTSNSDEILIVVSPKVISQGMYLGNLDGNDIRVSLVDLTEGLVYRETQSQIVSDSSSSFFNWFFKRIRRKTYAVSVMLPVYANALVTIAIRKDGSTAKCGMAVVGPVVDVGLSQYGLSTEIKDYSTTRFNFDGTSETTVRGYSKRMAIDVVLENDVIDSVQEQLAAFRQKPVAYLGAIMYGSTCLFGKFSTMKNVIKYESHSQMSLQIEGTV